jgi:protein MAK11
MTNNYTKFIPKHHYPTINYNKTLLNHKPKLTTRRVLCTKGFVLSCSDDGLICLTRVSDWETVKSLKGHKGGVLDIDCHKSGKVLMSVGKLDQYLRDWSR